MKIRPIVGDDYAAWKRLWDGYNAFYGRLDATALSPDITQSTWRRFLAPEEPMYALVAEADEGLIGLAHYLFHRSTTDIGLTCYLQDLFTLPASRRQGVARSLIESVYDRVRAQGIQFVYWQTHETNVRGRKLYDQVARYEGFIVYSRTL